MTDEESTLAAHAMWGVSRSTDLDIHIADVQRAIDRGNRPIVNARRIVNTQVGAS